ncbi:chemotaxis protein CheB [Polaromonas sp.]|uniref:chemotaxis protein CheB n=1 Tax=Polaromonas sp. TaxID=1869339 RepID=UPI00352A4305
MDNTVFDPEEHLVVQSKLPFPVVGIGASAGGLGALQRLLSSMPADCGMALVVVMHLSPDHESALGSILQRAGNMTVVTATASMRIEVDHAYVITPGYRLVMSDGMLQVFPLHTVEGRRQSIDLFFRSLAQAHRERAIGIVLSGTGTDGAQGLRRLKEMGGITVAQSPSDAEFDGMPRAAIETGVVDFVLPLDEMADKLALVWDNARRIELPDAPPDLQVEQPAPEPALLASEALLSIKALLKERTGHDFSHYKRGTVLRRLERRMQVRAMPDLPSYRQLLDIDPKETMALLQDMLISVTNFFRDPGAFEALGRALATHLQGRAQEPFRVWVAGCATGEEAYSVAMLLREAMGAEGPPISIFASDIDQRAVASARAGLFPASITADVSGERLQRFFVSDPAGWRVTKAVRDSVVFSTHNVLSDPAFTRMDLICCRNLMIYLDRSAQKQLLRSFHFALKPRGLLFLGSSETADAGGNLFEHQDKDAHLYRAAIVPARARSLPPLPPTPTRIPTMAVPENETPTPAPATPPLELLHQRIVRQYAPPSILVDADDTVLHVGERAYHLLRLPEGAPTNKLMSLARPELRAELRAAIGRATSTSRVVASPPVQLTINGEVHHVVITARPAKDESPSGLVLVVFDEAEESLAADSSAQARHPLVDALEAELLQAQDRLRSMAGESSASTEELRASNEELQTINEELRSTTEELETSREELQAVNEELTTVNAELTLRIEEASEINDDFLNLMNSADIGTVFVDREMLVRRFTPQAATLFNLLPADVGRPLLDIRHRLDYPQLEADIASVLRHLKRVEREIRSDDGRWFAAQVAPYRTSEDRIEGAAIALFDVTSRRATEDRLRSTERRMALVAESMRDYAIVTMDASGTIATWSTGATRIFGYEADEIIGSAFEVLFVAEDRESGKPEEELRRAREFGRCDDDRWHLRKDGQRIFCSGITTPLGDNGALGFAKIARDFTDVELREQRRDQALAAERAASGRLQEANALKDRFLAVVSHELKNPLSVIQMNAQLISHLPVVAADPRALRSAHSIKSAVASQTQLINALLELSRANMGKIVLSPAIVDMADLVRNVIDAAQDDARKKQLTLVATLESAPMFVDPVRIEQIVWNLVTNAIKFTPPEGTIQVKLTVQSFAVRLAVEDSGVGIPGEHLDHVFEMFHRGDPGATRGIQGLGIGLALVKQLVDLHHGSVAATSAGLGKGSTFTVTLPQAVGDGRIAAGVRSAASLEGLTLLVVDDDAEFLTVFADILRQEGATVETCRDTAHALTLSRTGRFHAVITDIAMPGHNGLWLAEQLRASEPTRALPLFAMSSMSRDADRDRASAAGFHGMVGKPIDSDRLREMILVAVSGRN